MRKPVFHSIIQPDQEIMQLDVIRSVNDAPRGGGGRGREGEEGCIRIVPVI